MEESLLNKQRGVQKMFEIFLHTTPYTHTSISQKKKKKQWWFDYKTTCVEAIDYLKQQWR